MNVSPKEKAVFGLAAGAALLCALFLWRGIETVAGFLAEAGIALSLVCLFSPPAQLMSAEAWRTLFPPAVRPRRARSLLASWTGSAVNNMLPVATIGGEIVKARILILWSHPSAETIAATTVDKTLQAIALLLWGLVGTAFLAFLFGETSVVTGILIGAGFLVLGIAGFIAIQIKGRIPLMAERSIGQRGSFGGAVAQGAEAVRPAIHEIYASPARLLTAIAWQVGDRMFLAGEVVLVSYLMGAPVGIVEAVILKSVIGALRGVSFAIPAGLGVQEGGYVAIGALIGYPPDLMIAVSLATRLREILPSLPFLFLWQAVEGKALWSKRRAKSAAAADG